MIENASVLKNSISALDHNRILKEQDERYSERINKLEAERKDLTKALEAIRDLTMGEQLPLMKGLYTIAHKTLKTINDKLKQ